MELKDFTRETLVQIVQGIEEAQEKIASTGARISPSEATTSGQVRQGFIVVPRLGFVEKVQFDVAVTTRESDSSSGGMGIFVAAIGVGARGESGTASESVSRVAFCVPLLLPSRDQ